MKKKLLIPIITIPLLCAAGVVGYFLLGNSEGGSDSRSGSTEASKIEIESLYTDRNTIYIGETEEIVFSAKASGSKKSSKAAPELYDENDKKIAVLKDDGKNGDEKEGDGIYSAAVSLSSDETAVKSFHVLSGKNKSISTDIIFYRDITAEEFEACAKLNTEIGNLTFSEACDFISSSDEITDFNIDKKDQTIEYRTVYNISGKWTEFSDEYYGKGEYALDKRATFFGPNGIYTNETLLEDVRSRVNDFDITMEYQDFNKVVFLEPFEAGSLALCSDFSNKYVNCFADSINMQLEHIANDKVTLEVMKSLDKYNVVIFCGHGDFVNDASVLLTGDTLEEGKFLKDTNYYNQNKKFSADYFAGNIVCYPNCTGDCLNRVAVAPGFFNTNYKNGSLNDSYWFLGACKSMMNTKLAESLRNKGAGAVVGFSDSVNGGYLFQSFFEVSINSMILSADTAKSGVEEALRIYKKQEGNGTYVKFHGDSNYRIILMITANLPIIL